MCTNRSVYSDKALALTVLIILLIATPIFGNDNTPMAEMTLFLDATDIDRRLIRSDINVSSSSEFSALLYPKWIPGAHGPTGPIENLAGFKVYDQSRSRIEWDRDISDPFRFNLIGPYGKSPVSIELQYICNQPTGLSWGCDCESNATIGVINWNAITVYPEGIPIDRISITPSLLLPTGWKYATAMNLHEQRGDTLFFEPVTFEELIDYPVICGPYLRSYQLDSTPSSKYWIHVAVDEDRLLPKADSIFSDTTWSNMVRETEAMFGRTHFSEYHFLIPISDSISRYGLEHRNSSVNSHGTKSLTEYGQSLFFLQWVLPHEFIHSWCGKYRRPKGMSRSDFQSSLDMSLLWVYEGLTEYLGTIMTARSGFMDYEYFKEELALYWGNLEHKKGRQWRSLKDIAVSTQTVWGGSDSWLFHRRAADYYSEGSMLWLEVDARIRHATNGTKSLDDFCKVFFGSGDASVHSITYRLADITNALSALTIYNWDSLFAVRIEGVFDALDETPLEVSGYKLGFSAQKPLAVANDETRDECHYYYESLGLAINDEDNRVLQIVPESPSDRAGLCSGMTVLGINGRTFSFDRLDTALDQCRASGNITFLISHGEMLKEYDLIYDGGNRYYNLERIGNRPDLLSEIVKPSAM